MITVRKKNNYTGTNSMLWKGTILYNSERKTQWGGGGGGKSSKRGHWMNKEDG